MKFDDEIEERLHFKLKDLFDFFYSTDRIIKKKFGRELSGIDHIGIIGNYFISIQDKNGHYKIADVGHFINSTKTLEDRGYNLLSAYFVCKDRDSKTIRDMLNVQGDKYQIFDINNEFFIDELFKDIKEKLISLNIIKLEYNIELKDHQKKAISNYQIQLYNGVKYSILQHVTASGKTITTLGILNVFLSKYPNASILWLTERIDILKSQFDNDEIQKVGGKISDIEILRLYNETSYNISKIPNILYDVSDSQIFLITNIGKIKYGEKNEERYRNMRRFDIVVFDECHSSGAIENFNMLRYMKNIWNCYIIGISATPIREKYINHHKEIFGCNSIKGNVNFIDKMTMIRALKENIIVPPRFYWVECDNKNISKIDINESVNYILSLIMKSKTKRILCWSKDIKHSYMWKDIFDDNDIYTYISNSKEDESGTQINKFLSDKSENIRLLLCVGRCKEGFNFQRIDTVIDLDACKKRGMINFIQKVGRCLRKYEYEKDGVMKHKKYGNIIETFTFEDEDNKMKSIIDKILGYPLFLEIFEHIKRKNKIKNISEIFKFHIDKDKNKFTFKFDDIEIENNIICQMKNFKWDKFDQDFKERLLVEILQEELTYERMRILLSDLGIKNKSEYYDIAKTNIIFPSNPIKYFKMEEELFNWFEYLNINVNNLYSYDKMKFKMKNEMKILKSSNIEEILDICCQKYNKFPPRDLCRCYVDIILKKRYDKLLSGYNYK